uniref:Uncharacterized protein n=1 Tax=Astyanax mexicanus TaxID=7994 RepID=A0A8B9H597_ASTMX
LLISIPQNNIQCFSTRECYSYFRLWDCKITEEGCAALASALKSNPSHLRKLDLTANKIGDSGSCP